MDITVRVQPDDIPNLWHELENYGFRLRVSDPESFVARARVLPFLHIATEMNLDVILAGPGIEDRFFERAVPLDVEGLQVPVATPEDLIVMKILAGRPKDLEDVRTILKERLAKLDLAHVRSMLDLLEKALDQSDLLPVLEAEIERARRSRLGR
jgi:hypothetical protein